MSDADNVRVAVRVRPLSTSERERGCSEQVHRIAGEQQVTVATTDSFTFNYVFDPSDTQEKLYKDCVLEMLDGLFNGFNATILAYGQTGSGKTYTMGTAFDGELSDDAGVIPRAMVDLFQRMEQLSDSASFTVTCSFMELYQEQLYDLLSSQPREQNVVELREDRNGFVIPTCLTEETVLSARDTTDCLVRGSKGRAVGCTAMNQHSSRSHAIFTVTIKAAPKNETGIATTSKFRLVDLAGSERSKKTQATGDRFKEGVKINQGLLALGNVISALGSNQGANGFVRYRDSKLTRLLQDSLGGNSITLMIACVSPADYNIQETLSTLRYADRARRIKNKPVVNKEPTANEIKRLNGIIRELYSRLIEAGGAVPVEMASALKHIVTDLTPSSSTTSLGQYANNDSLYQELKEKYMELQKQMRTAMQDLTDKEVRAHAVEAACEKTKSKTHDIMVILNSLHGDLSAQATPDELEEHNKRIQSVKDVMIQLNNELDEMQQEIDSNATKSTNLVDIMPPANANEVCTLLEEEEDDYVQKQNKYKQELALIKAELDLKNELRQRVEGNLSKMTPIDETILEKYRESEHKIKTLETEKAELEEKLNQKFKDNASAKLAESRRQRLQLLEQELGKLRLQRAQQEKTLKQYQVQVDRVKDLNTQIQKMKESKVKLVRTMRQESENFRQWKFAREKELTQLRNKDRKLMNEMARQKAAHTRIYNNLQRRLEEANAAKKRYIERDMAAQKIRMAIHSAKGAPQLDRLINLIERDIEVVMSLIEAENSLKQLKEDRTVLCARIDELEKIDPPPAANSPEADELSNLKSDLELRKSQIADIEHKVLTADKDKRMKMICDNIMSVSDTRSLLRRLLTSMLVSHSEAVHKLSEQKAQCEELRSKLDASEKQGAELSEQLRTLEVHQERRLLEQENAYEEKISVLLRELHNKVPQLYNEQDITPEQQKCIIIREEQLNKMEAMREELDYYKELVANMKEACTAQKRRKLEPPPPIVDFVNEDEMLDLSDEDIIDEDDDTADPDWRKTPAVRKRSKRYGSRNNSTDETFVTANNVADNTFPVTAISAVISKIDQIAKRKSNKCYCRGKCSNNRCGCHANGDSCNTSCRCGDDCVNNKSIGDHNDRDDSADTGLNEVTGQKTQIVVEGDDENKFKSPAKVKDDDPNSLTFSTNGSTFITPKIARMSSISFMSASARKKFFD